MVALVLCTQADANAGVSSDRLPPAAEAVVLRPDVFWRSMRSPGPSWTNRAAVELYADLPLFRVANPDSRHEWSYRFAVPVPRMRYPMVSISYRASGLAALDEAFLRLDDGRGQAYSQWSLFRSSELIADGQLHTLRRDLREHTQGDRIDGIYLSLHSAADQEAWLEVTDLRFEAEAAPSAKVKRSAPMTIRVRDAEGAPVHGAKVTMDAERLNWAQSQSTEGDMAEVEIAPRVTETGKHMVRVAKAEFVTVERRVDTRFGQLAVVLPRGTMYGGQVVDIAGQPMAGVALQVHVRHERVSRLRPVPTLFTDSHGRWRTPVMPATGLALELQLSHPDVAAPTVVRTVSMEQLASGESRIELEGTQLDVHRAAQLGMAAWLAEALKRDPSLVNKIQDRLTPLHVAAQYDRVAAIDVLLDHGASLIDMTPWSTPLHRALEFGSLHAARHLLEQGADAGMLNDSGSSLLHHAIWAQSDGLCSLERLLGSIELLLEFDADVNVVHRNVGTPLDYALKISPPQVAQLLEAHGAEAGK